MKENINQQALTHERRKLFDEAERKLLFQADVYPLGDRFEGLSPELTQITMLDVTKIPGCHYGLKNIFVPIIRHLEETKNVGPMVVSPETTILVEASTGNGWGAFSDAANMLGYEHVVIMPDGLPETRYIHPQGRKVEIIRTPKQDYAEGMPKKLQALISENKQRLREGKKTYISPNHAVSGGKITIKTMSEIARQLLTKPRSMHEPLRIVISMGNGSSLCAIGEFVKANSPNAKIVATESFAYGAGYDAFAQRTKGRTYKELFGINPGQRELMANFSAIGTNAPIGIELPLQTRAINEGLLDDYVLFTDDKILEAYKKLGLSKEHVANALGLPNCSGLPRILFETYGNSTLANIAVASRFPGKGERVVAMAYDGRKNY